MKSKMNKSSLIILIVVGVIVLAVAGYGIWQAVGTGKGGEETSSNASAVSNTVELNDENLNGTWERTDGTIIHHLTFSENQKLTYEKFENDSDTPVLTSTDGFYEISGNKVTISVIADGDTVTETCEAVLSKDTLVLTGTSEQSGFFAGNYEKSKQQEEPSSTPESSSSEPESAALPESTAPPESTVSPEPKPESKPQAYQLPEKLRTLLDMSLSELYGGSIPEPDGYYQTCAYYKNPQYPNLVFYYQIDGGTETSPYMISATIDYLIPGKTACTYQELKDVLGDNIGEISYMEMDSTYWVNGFIDGYRLTFSTASPPPNGEFTSFKLIKA